MFNFKKLKWYTWLIILAIPGMLVAAYFKAKNKPKGEAVSYEKVERRNIVETVSASGKIYPETEIKISSDVSGEITELYVKEGDSVKVGQILARVNPDAYESAVERSTAGVNVARTQSHASSNTIENARQLVQQAKLQYENARKTHERNKELFKDGIISQAEFETSETSLKNLEAGVKSAESGLRNAEKTAEAAKFQVKDAEAVLKEQRTNLGRTIIKAPASGIISKLNVEKGERVVGTIQMSGTEMMRIADLQAMEVQVEVSENDIVRVKVGDDTDIEVDAYSNKKFFGKVTEVSNSASNVASLGSVGLSTDQVSKYIVKVRVDKESYRDLTIQGRPPFRPGMSATVEIKTAKAENVLSIPIQSVIAYDPDEKKTKEMKELAKERNDPNANQEEEEKASQFREAVFVLKGDTVARVDVNTGIQDIEYIEIKSGIEESDMVITGPYVALSKKLKSGSRVHQKKDESKKDDQKD